MRADRTEQSLEDLSRCDDDSSLAFWGVFTGLISFDGVAKLDSYYLQAVFRHWQNRPPPFRVCIPALQLPGDMWESMQ